MGAFICKVLRYILYLLLFNTTINFNNRKESIDFLIYQEYFNLMIYSSFTRALLTFCFKNNQKIQRILNIQNLNV